VRAASVWRSALGLTRVRVAAVHQGVFAGAPQDMMLADAEAGALPCAMQEEGAARPAAAGDVGMLDEQEAARYLVLLSPHTPCRRPAPWHVRVCGARVAKNFPPVYERRERKRFCFSIP
jgi:hypothetical protein